VTNGTQFHFENFAAAVIVVQEIIANLLSDDFFKHTQLKLIA